MNSETRSFPNLFPPVLTAAALALPFSAALAQSTNGTVVMDKATVVGHLDDAREQIVPSLGASAYLVSAERIGDQVQGANSAFNQVLLRTPGMAQDSYGQVHLRGEHANLQYRINDVLLPEGISGFGQELDTRFVDQLQIITGTLPAQYGFRTAGVVDIHTRSGAFLHGGEVGIYGGSHETLKPSFELGGSSGSVNYYFTGSYTHTGLGLENPTADTTALHDRSDQYRGFGYLSRVLDDTSRLSLFFAVSQSDFQIPNRPGQPAGTDSAGNPFPLGGVIIDSARLDETQSERNAYAVLAYQKTAEKLDFQVAGFVRGSGVLFKPDRTGDLFFDGVASRVDRRIASTGLEANARFELTDQHILRAGATVIGEQAAVDTTTSVFAIDSVGAAFGSPFDIQDSHRKTGLLGGVYLQDEWRISRTVTLNFGGRFDAVAAYSDETQLSPRANLVWQANPETTLHAGYARTFTPPPLELVQAGTLGAFAGTSNASEVTQSSPVRSERMHYFDIGITRQITRELSAGVDAYYKTARHQLDDGFFGQTLIPSPFNYQQGRIYGVEWTASFNRGGFSSYANVAWSKAEGRTVDSGEFLFSQSDLNALRDHWVGLDHDQRVTGSFGAAYGWNRTRIFADALYGSGLRRDLELAGGFTLPNGGSVPAYFTVNLGVEQRFDLQSHRLLKLRLELVNLTDNSYVLRDGSGIGVNAPQYGARFGAALQRHQRRDFGVTSHSKLNRTR